jgi:hypothetical protein
MAKKVTGGCACGSIRYQLLDKPMFVHCCHCDDCQRLTGSAFVLNAIIETQAIKLVRGKPVAVPVPRENGPHDIYRCLKCQTAVWSDYGHRPNIRFVRVGTLDKPGALKPDVHIHTRTKASGSNCRSERRRSGITTTPGSSGPKPASNASTPRSERRRADRLRRLQIVHPSQAIAATQPHVSTQS